jgi:glycosyltransferase involved in cell wall biosynthesis
MKIFVVSHTYIAPINRAKWKIFAKKFPDVQIKVIIPKTWSATLFQLYAGDLAKGNTRNCEFIALDTKRTGNEVLYRYKYFDIVRILRKFKPNIIHVEQGDSAFSYFQSIFLSKIFCRSAKCTFFTWVNWKAKRTWKYRLFWRFVEKFNLRFSHGAFVGNSDAKCVLQDKNFKKPIEVLLQLGVNQNFFYPSKQEKQKKYIGYVGRMLERKGLFYLVDAFKMLADEFLEWDLLLVGAGPDKEKLISYVAKKGLQDRVEFRNSVIHEKIADVFRELEIFVLPSFDTPTWREQFGHVLIEAMASKVAIVGSSGGDIPNVIGEAGIIFEQKKVLELQKSLKLLMDDQNLRDSFAQKGYERFQKSFSYDVIVTKTSAFWRQFL